jgi:uncharacterized protein
MSPTPASAEAQIVDSVVLAANVSSVAREYSIVDLPRVAEAGGLAGTSALLTFRLSDFDRHPAIHGVLRGGVVLTCQRCLNEFRYELDEPFDLVVVNSQEDAASVPESHDAVVADPTRLDLRWLAEEQVLLALPFAPKHESEEDCRAAAAKLSAAAAMTVSQDGAVTQKDKQRPFANLREMLGKR